MKPIGKWGSRPSISPEAVARRQRQNCGSSRPNGDTSFPGCPALGQRYRVLVTVGFMGAQLISPQNRTSHFLNLSINA